MKKWILVAAVVLIFVAFAVYQHDESKKAIPVVATSPVTSTPAVSTTPITTPAIATTAPAVAAQAPSGQYKDGTYAGSVANAFYGNIQVAAVISGGKLSDVQVLQYPNDSGHSKEVNASSLPQLKTEAIQAQSANVNVISGATQTSEGFSQSLASALSLAKN